MTAAAIVREFGLEPHPEGGFFRETYRAQDEVQTKEGKSYSAATLIYFLLQGSDVSHFHRIASDEMWFFHLGGPLRLFWIDGKGRLDSVLLGSNWQAGEQLQWVVRANTWFAARLEQPASYALVSCAVAPGFDFTDFEMANHETMRESYPRLYEEILPLILDSRSRESGINQS